MAVGSAVGTGVSAAGVTTARAERLPNSPGSTQVPDIKAKEPSTRMVPVTLTDCPALVVPDRLNEAFPSTTLPTVPR